MVLDRVAHRTDGVQRNMNRLGRQSGFTPVHLLIILLILAILAFLGNCITRSQFGTVNVTGLAVTGPSTIHLGKPATFTVILATDKAPTFRSAKFKVNIIENDPVFDDNLIIELEVEVGRGQTFAFKTFTLTCKERNSDGTSVIEGASGMLTDEEDVHEIQVEGTGIFLFDSNDHSVVCVAAEEEEAEQ